MAEGCITDMSCVSIRGRESRAEASWTVAKIKLVLGAPAGLGMKRLCAAGGWSWRRGSGSERRQGHCAQPRSLSALFSSSTPTRATPHIFLARPVLLGGLSGAYIHSFVSFVLPPAGLLFDPPPFPPTTTTARRHVKHV